jgi:hypothetical protein
MCPGGYPIDPEMNWGAAATAYATRVRQLNTPRGFFKTDAVGVSWLFVPEMESRRVREELEAGGVAVLGAATRGEGSEHYYVAVVHTGDEPTLHGIVYGTL